MSVNQFAEFGKMAPRPLDGDPTPVMRPPISPAEQQPAASEIRADFLHAAFQIHQGPAQYLTAVLTRLRLCERYLFKDVSRAQAILRESLEGVQTALDAVRATIDMLRYPRVTSGEALEWGLRAIVDRLRSTCAVRFFEDLEDVGALPHDVAVGLSEIACEALTNAVKHAEARHITISLLKRRNEIILEVTDDGKGCRGPRTTHRRHGQGAGVALMQERARRLGCILSIESVFPIGTLVRAVITLA